MCLGCGALALKAWGLKALKGCNMARSKLFTGKKTNVSAGKRKTTIIISIITLDPETVLAVKGTHNTPNLYFFDPKH